jgi:hypothetical protein
LLLIFYTGVCVSLFTLCLKPSAKYVGRETNFICMASKIPNILEGVGVTVWSIL